METRSGSLLPSSLYSLPRPKSTNSLGLSKANISDPPGAPLHSVDHLQEWGTAPEPSWRQQGQRREAYLAFGPHLPSTRHTGLGVGRVGSTAARPGTGACSDPVPSSHLFKVWLHEAHTNTVSLWASGAEKGEELGETLPHALWLMTPTTRTTSPAPKAPQTTHCSAHTLANPAH